MTLEQQASRTLVAIPQSFCGHEQDLEKDRGVVDYTEGVKDRMNRTSALHTMTIYTDTTSKSMAGLARELRVHNWYVTTRAVTPDPTGCEKNPWVPIMQFDARPQCALPRTWPSTPESILWKERSSHFLMFISRTYMYVSYI